MPETHDEFRVALQANIERVTGSDVFCCLYSDSMADFLEDPWPAIQLTIAILADKPIAIASLPGREPPAKLRAIADTVIYGEPHELADQLSAWMQDRDQMQRSD